MVRWDDWLLLQYFFFLVARYDAADMNVFRSALSACVLSGLEDVHNLITLARQQMIDEQNVKRSHLVKVDSTQTSIVPVGTLAAAVGALSAALDHITRNNT